MKRKSNSAARLLTLQKIGFQLQAEKLRKDYSNKKKFNQISHEQKSLSRKRILSQIEVKQNIGNFLQPTRIISVSAHKWVIYDFFTMKYNRGYGAHNKAQLGVFSKLLVFCTINTLLKKHKLDPHKFQTIVSSNVLKMFPKHNILKVDDIISLQDLLHLMVLDQSEIYQVILCVNVGTYLYKKHKHQYYSVYDVNQRSLQSNLKYFYQLVNSYCKLMHLENITYIEADPVLRKDVNFCTAADVARLAIQCMNIPLYNTILKKISHSIEVKFVDSQGHLSHRHFSVFNRSIEQKFIPYVNICRNWQEKQFLSSHCVIQYEDSNVEVRPIIVVLLSSYSPKDRQKDIQQIVEWYLKSEKQVKDPIKNSQSIRKNILKTEPIQTVNETLQRKIEQKLSLNRDSKYSIYESPERNRLSQPSNKRIRKVINIKTQQSS